MRYWCLKYWKKFCFSNLARAWIFPIWLESTSWAWLATPRALSSWFQFANLFQLSFLYFLLCCIKREKKAERLKKEVKLGASCGGQMKLKFLKRNEKREKGRETGREEEMKERVKRRMREGGRDVEAAKPHMQAVRRVSSILPVPMASNRHLPVRFRDPGEGKGFGDWLHPGANALGRRNGVWCSGLKICLQNQSDLGFRL